MTIRGTAQSFPYQRTTGLLLGLTVLAGMSACRSDEGSSGSSGPGASSGQVLEIKDFAFKPQTLEVPSRSKITVRNSDGAAHTVTADNVSFDTGNIDGGEQREIVAPEPGQIAYKCNIHQYMRGVIRISGS